MDKYFPKFQPKFKDSKSNACFMMSYKRREEIRESWARYIVFLLFLMGAEM